MINFRYHVVSLAAVFLALAIGLVVGTAAANGPLADDLSDQVTDARATNQQLRDDLDQARVELEKTEDYAKESAPMLLSGKLTGKNVLLLVLEGNDKDVDKAADGVADRLTTAGAKLTGRIKLREKFTAAASKDELLDLADTAAPPAVSGALPGGANAADTSTALLAAVLVGKAGTPAVEGTRSVLSAYENNGFLTMEGDFKVTAEAVVIVGGGAPTGKDAKERAAALLTVATRFNVAVPGRMLVAGLSATGLVQAVRDDASIRKDISTVDNVVTAKGQVSAALALAERLGGKSGHYGIGDGATTLLPTSASVRDGS